MNTEIEQLTAILKESNNIVFFRGAGVSTEGNIIGCKKHSLILAMLFSM